MGKVLGGKAAITGEIKDHQMPTGTHIELVKEWERAERYLYKILSYAPKDTEKPLTKEQLERERRYLKFLRLGPRAGYLRHATKTKLTSADVLYILTCTIPAKKLQEMYNVSHETINGIRRGSFVEWTWEYHFVKRLKTHIKSEIYSYGGHGNKEEHARIRIFKLERLNPDMTLEVVGYITGIRKAKVMRQELCNKKDYDRYVKDGTLEIYWPITKIDVM
jgi:hypothetical protein